MSSEKTPILFIGAPGYIGGSVLGRLLEHPSANTFDITVFTTYEEKAGLLESKFPLKVVRGSRQNFDNLEALAEHAHIVFNCVDASDVPVAKAILNGLKKRHMDTGDLPILIHTSGTSVLTGDPLVTVYSDVNVEQMKTIPVTNVHRNANLAVVEADVEGYARTHIIFPATIYGIAEGALFDAGVSYPHSVQLPYLIKAALARKSAGIVGMENALWPNVHIHDGTATLTVADLYMTLFNAILCGKSGHGWEGLYFAENGEHNWHDVNRAIGDALVACGIAADPEPTPVSIEDHIRYYGDISMSRFYSGISSSCRADRGRSIGWSPKYTAEDMLKSIKPEVEAIIKQQKEGKA
ncbi:hypothetical protein TRAPUB_8481 [Trametes pubescens]|uniref:NAD(P)-binding domain-containing protein n=1 Tax=Trametes pubescens TaxID=154538 RepID=A0A1M2W5A4_TRAPU|nr:hypothetical protein TRAPUB_8481 [Trametes pubescens]